MSAMLTDARSGFHWTARQRTHFKRLIIFIKWLVFSVLIGLVVGFAGVGFHRAIAGAEYINRDVE